MPSGMGLTVGRAPKGRPEQAPRPRAQGQAGTGESLFHKTYLLTQVPALGTVP